MGTRIVKLSVILSEFSLPTVAMRIENYKTKRFHLKTHIAPIWLIPISITLQHQPGETNEFKNETGFLKKGKIKMHPKDTLLPCN